MKGSEVRKWANQNHITGNIRYCACKCWTYAYYPVADLPKNVVYISVWGIPGYMYNIIPTNVLHILCT